MSALKGRFAHSFGAKKFYGGNALSSQRFDVIEDIRAICFELTGQSVEAANYLISNPEEVAFSSMREIARRANVPPVSLVRLAQKLGLSGYSELKDRFIKSIQDPQSRVLSDEMRNVESARALLKGSRSKNSSTESFIQDFFLAEAQVLHETHNHLTAAQATEAATLLATAKRVFVCAKRTAFPAAFLMKHLLLKARPDVIFMDGVGGAPESSLEDITAQDVVVCFTFSPFNKTVHSFAKHASDIGAKVIAVTDSFSAPIGEYAKSLHITVASSSKTFLESSVGAIAVAQLLCALTVNKLGYKAQERIRRNETYLVRSGEYLPTGKRAARGR
jgi:DNA-binding MurR/RpiR family transcriptional regulator